MNERGQDHGGNRGRRGVAVTVNESIPRRHNPDSYQIRTGVWQLDLTLSNPLTG